MSLVVVEAAITLTQPAARDALVADSVELQRRIRDEQPGCLGYCLSADPVHADRVQVLETWDSPESLDAHLRGPNYFAMLELISAAGIASAAAQKHLVDRSAPIYGPDGKPTGLFD